MFFTAFSYYLFMLQEKKKENKSKKTKDKSIDNELAAKLSSLGGENNIDLAALLASDDSSDSSDTSSDEKTKKKKKKKIKEKKSKTKKTKKAKKKSKKKESKKKVSDDSDSSEEELKKKRKHKKDRDSKELKRRISPSRDRSLDEHKLQKLAERSRHRSRSRDKEQKRYYRTNIEHKRHENREIINLDSKGEKYRNRSRSDHHRETDKPSQSNRQSQSNRRSRSRERQNQVPGKRSGMTDSERAAKLAEMVRAGAEHEVRRGQRVAAQRVADEVEPKTSVRPAHAHAHSLPNSLESRIQSNRHYIQRNKGHMNEHFARR